MNGFEVLIPIFGILLVLVPVTGVTFILTARFAMKPLVETLASALRESGFAATPEAQREVRELTEQVEALTEQVTELRRGQEFDRKLLAGRSGAGAAR